MKVLRHKTQAGVDCSKCRYRLVLTLLPLCFTIPVVVAQQPFATDDANTTQRQKGHFEFFDEHDILQPSLYPAKRQNTANFKLNYGLTDHIELDFDIPLLTIYNSQVSRVGNPTGIGDADFGVKYNFSRESHGSRWPAMAIALYVEFPTGSVEKQLGSGLTDYNFYGIAQKTLAKETKLRINVGVIFAGNNSTGLVGISSPRGRIFTTAVSLIKDFDARLSFGVEANAAWTSNLDLHERQLTILVGGKYAIWQKLSLDCGLLGGVGEGSPRIGALIGISINFN